MCKLISSSTHFLKWVTRFCIFQIGYKATLLFGKRLQGLLDKCMVHATDMIFLKEGLGWIVAFIEYLVIVLFRFLSTYLLQEIPSSDYNI